MAPAVPDPCRFVGRATELETLLRWYEEGTARAAIVGAAGTGKSRLIEAFRKQVADAIYCDLGRPEGDPAAWTRLAWALELSLAGIAVEHYAPRISSALAAHAGRLLILDHAEGLETWLDALVETLPPDVSVWSVSRFRTADLETTNGVPTLHVDAFPCPDAESIAGSPAALLWEQWAQATQPTYSLRADDTATVAAILKRLNGVPLAITLAASRLHVLGTQELLRRLEGSLDVLAGESGGLETALAWSWQLLDRHERRVLSQCSVFHGGFDARAVEHIVDAYGDEASPTTSGTGPTTLAFLVRLRNASLLGTTSTGDQSRLYLWSSVAEFARKHCETQDHIRAARLRHAEYYGQRARDWWKETLEWGDLRRSDIVIADQENLRAAAEWFIGHERRDEATWVLLVLGHLAWDHRRSTAGLLDLLDSALALTPEETLRASLDLACLFLVRSKLLVIAGKERDAEEDIRRAHVIARHGQHPAIEALALEHHGRLLVRSGDLDGGLSALRNAESLANDAGCDQVRIRVAHDLAARAMLLGNLREARAHLEGVLTLHTGQYTPRWRVAALRRLGEVAADEGRLGDALRYFEEARRFWDVASDSSDGWYAWIALEQGDTPRAAELFRTAMNDAESTGSSRNHGQLALGLALSQWRSGESTAVDTHLETTIAKIPTSSDGSRVLAFALRAWFATLHGRTNDAARFESEARALLDQVHDTRRRRLVELILTRLATGELTEWNDVETTSLQTSSLELRICSELGRSTTLSSRPPEIQIDAKGHTFSIRGGETIDLRRRAVLRKLLNALLETREARPGVSLPNDDLIAAGWPGEKIIPQAALARLYVSMQRLRQAGLGRFIEAEDGGYRISAEVRVVRA